MSLARDPLPSELDALRAFAAGLQAELAHKELEIAANAAEIRAKTLHIEKLKIHLAVRIGRRIVFAAAFDRYVAREVTGKIVIEGER